MSLALTLESGRRVACDIGDCDPERMAPPKVEEYVKGLFSNSNIKISVVSDEKEIKKDFPLFEAVNRAASVVERHRGRIIFLEYNPPESIEETLYFVGKGEYIHIEWKQVEKLLIRARTYRTKWKNLKTIANN